jgi:hypothetical protein
MWRAKESALRTRGAKKGLLAGTASLVWMLPGISHAQWRENQPPVATPPVQHIAQPLDVIGPFASAYQAAGEPRILLFWNVTFDDSTETARQNVDTTKRSSTESSNALDKRTEGPAGDATLHEGDSKKGETIERVTGERAIDSAKHSTPLSARNAVELETAFRQQLQSAGVHLVDRAASIRFTQAARDRTGVDPKLIEADAVVGNADLLLEVIMVFDRDAPLGAGFKVTVTDVKSGAQVLSFFTDARPEPPQQPSHYVVTDSGFEKRQPRAQATVRDVGIALARDIMRSMGPRLTANHHG